MAKQEIKTFIGDQSFRITSSVKSLKQGSPLIADPASLQFTTFLSQQAGAVATILPIFAVVLTPARPFTIWKIRLTHGRITATSRAAIDGDFSIITNFVSVNPAIQDTSIVTGTAFDGSAIRYNVPADGPEIVFEKGLRFAGGTIIQLVSNAWSGSTAFAGGDFVTGAMCVTWTVQ